MRLYYDWEFLEDGESIWPISLGMVREDGVELYCVNEEIYDGGPGNDGLYRKILKHRWLMENVVPNLPLATDVDGRPRYGIREGNSGLSYFHLDMNSNLVVPRRMIRNAVRDLVLDTPDPELWAWYGAYDHVCLAQLFGRMVNLPKGFPMYTRDLKQEVDRLGAPALPAKVGTEHNALDDARWNARLGDYLKQYEGERTA
jgi:hypothetical protein